MNETHRWGAPRYVILAVVLMLHAVLLVALLTMLQARNRTNGAVNSLELVFLAPVIPPKPRTVDAGLHRLGGDISVVIAPPVPGFSSAMISAPGLLSPNGGESGVDWAAEARRALQAFEIRSHLAAGTKSVSARPEEDNWMPNSQHRAGEQFKMANGDWIVWIDANCYAVASAGPSASAAGQKLPEIVCRNRSGAMTQ
jgi:hypothetical protein